MCRFDASIRWNNKARAADMTGQRFGRLVCEERVISDGVGGARWRCLCDCGKRAVVRRRSLINGDTQSCGCLRADAAGRRWRDRSAGGQSSLAAGARHGGAKTSRTLRLANAFADVFGTPVDTVHIDRPGARVVRGGKY